MEGLIEYLRQVLVQQGQATAQNVVPFSTQLAMAVVVFLVTRLLASKAQRSVMKGMTLAKADAHAALLVSRVLYFGVWSVGMLIILGVFGINWTAIVAAFGVIGLALTVSLQDVLKNFVAGIYILLERPFCIGDVVRVKEFSGTVEDVRLRTTCLRQADGTQAIVPNSTIFIEVVVNSGAVVAKEQVEQR